MNTGFAEFSVDSFIVFIVFIGLVFWIVDLARYSCLLEDENFKGVKPLTKGQYFMKSSIIASTFFTFALIVFFVLK
ncbi:hypothetical protein [Acinetobacter nosocomialis]|uniref:hypothetical protein n=1 Tax=Acinetobacter nosocomialis TaxID=106654 RepID=UPI001F47E115|nr:hypothetical protein [Acinetobacter nosocomialis]MCE7534244.1 hypothetical protein [Acinetobacter nosocomialis]